MLQYYHFPFFWENKYNHWENNPNILVQFELILQSYLNHTIIKQMNKIALPTSNGFRMIAITDIIRCEADSNYTLLVLENGKEILVSRQLKILEHALPKLMFVRVHHSHLINLNYISHFVRNGGYKLYMTNDDVVEVSRNRKKDLMDKINLI